LEDLVERLERGGATERKADLVGAFVELDHDAEERTETLAIHRDVVGVADLQREGLADSTRERVEALALGAFVEAVEERGHQAHAPAADVDPELEGEPIGFLLVVDLANVRVERGLLFVNLEGILRVDVD